MSLHDLAKRTAPQSLLERADPILRKVLNDTQDIHFIMLCSSDGFELITHKREQHTLTSGRIAAVSSSILAMVHAFMAEIQLKGCQTITLDAENGKALITSLNHAQYPMVLVTLCDSEILLGQLRYSIKQCTDQITQLTV